jgi:predicted transcriptional regulator
MTDKYITISLNQAIQLRGILNTSASDLREIVERHEKGYPFIGKLYHEYKAAQLKKFGKIIDKKIKSWQEKT